MEFRKAFTEAAQNAILVKLNNGTWEDLPWLAKHVKDVISDGVAAMLVTTDGASPLTLADLAQADDLTMTTRSQFVDYHGKEVPVDAEATSGKTIQAAVGKGPVVEIPVTFEDVVDKYGIPNHFMSDDFSWQAGYPFKIMVTLRDKSKGAGYCVHYKERPSYEEFDRHFALTRQRTHNVFIRQADGSKSWDITDDMLTRPAPEETFTATDEWPEGKTHRIKFHDQRTGQLNYVYFDYQPTGIILKKYHSLKGFAVVQSRPEGV
ncbi:hypothetical protein HWC14_gp20 [Serratia phage Parlo]|uniref:Uncharacterized protein n=1 Tax=Serratia phage Parlo TaxID=2557554 RepID=A0A482MG43_9CAUD|nr:hypothetical protein HWC14_gp20 [Serratia phage Parlo]QBQ72169.1 hypothetical protein CPT_Parlo_020 [Serratia phage Parlo]